MIVGEVTRSKLLLSMGDLKATRMNVQRSLIQSEFELGNNAAEATKLNCCAKSEGTVDHGIVIRWLKKFCSSGKNLDDQAKSGGPKTVNSDAVLQAIVAERISNFC